MSEQLDTIHAVESNFDAIFTWDYSRSRPALVKLYEKAKASQWNASTDLDWSIDVDPEKVGSELGGADQRGRSHARRNVRQVAPVRAGCARGSAACRLPAVIGRGRPG